MKFILISVLFIGFLLTSCGTSKDAVKPGKSKDAVSFSSKDYPYLEAFHTGVRLKTVGDIDGATASFEKCLAIRQNDDAVYFALSELALAKGNKPLAQAHILKARDLDPENIWYTQNLSYSYYDAENFEKAVPEFKKLTIHEPKNLEWLYGYGDCLLRIGKTQDAINVLNKAEDLMGMNPELSIEKYSLYMTLKKETEALNEINKARKVFPNDPQLIATLVDHYFKKGENQKGTSFLEELVKNDPENGRARLFLGEVYLKSNKKDLAFPELKKAFEAPDVTLDSKMQILIALQQITYKPEPRAVELMEILVQQHPTEAKSYSIQGDYYLALEEEQKAILAYRKATELDRNQFPIWNQLLLLEYQNAMFQDLYKDSKQCLEYFTTQPTVYLLNGIGALQTKHYDEAIVSLEAGKSLVVNNPSLEGEFYGQLGDTYFSSGNYAEGKKNFESALKLDPQSNLLKNNYAYKLATAKTDLDKALSLINLAIANTLENAVYFDTKGFIYFQKTDYDEAFKMFESAFKLNPNEPDIADHLADAYFKKGMTDKAIEFWNKAKALGSKNKSLEQKIERKTFYEPVFE